MSRIVPSTPANSLTPSYSTVSSPGGFQSGDLVYYKDSSFGTIPNNAVTSANFPLTANVSLGQNAFNSTVNWANYNPNGRPGSTENRAPSCALLTNGNIVVVYGETVESGAAPAAFKIIDQNGSQVVGATPLGRSISQNITGGCIGVSALTGGGFAIGFLDSLSGNLYHGVFSNTGAVVTAIAQDTSFGLFSFMDMKPLPNGGYVIATNSGQASSGSFRTRVYSSLGVPGTASSFSATASLAFCPIIGVFSDGSFSVMAYTGSTNMGIFRFDSTGVSVSNFTLATDYQSDGGYDFIVLSDNTARAIYVENQSGFNRMIVRSVASGGGTSLVGTVPSTNYTQTVNAAPLSSGGYILARSNNSSGCVVLARYNTTNLTQISAVSLPGVSAYTNQTYQGTMQRTTVLEGATWLTLVSNTPAGTSRTYGALPFVQIDKNNITSSGVRGRFNSNVAVAQVNAPVSGYARGSSTPNSASFLAQNTQTITRTINTSDGSDFALAPYTAITDTCNWQSMTEMNNGQFVIAYRTTSGSVRFSVFNQDGSVFSNTIVTASSVASNLVRCICLGNGKLVISWANSANNDIFFAVYSSSYAQLATGNAGTAYASITSPGTTNNAPGHDIAAYGNDFFILALRWNSGSTTSVAVYSDSCVYQNETALSTGTWHNLQLGSDASGNYALRLLDNSSGVGRTYFGARNNGANTISPFYASTSISEYNTPNFNEGFVLAPNGTAAGYTNQSGNRRFWRTVPTQGYNIAAGSMNSTCAIGVTVGHNGEIVSLSMQSGSVYVSTQVPISSQASFGSNVGTSNFSFNSLTITDFSTTSTTGPRPQIVNVYDNIYAFSYISSTDTIRVGMLCLETSTYSANLTAGVTPSGTALVPSPANGYYLAGVSASECAAGGTGVLQVNGAATLNSQYPAGTPSQAFDFNSPALDAGVRGTIAGRNVILSGGK